MQHWLRGGHQDEKERIADLVRFGIDEAEARQYLAANEEPVQAVYAVWAQHEEVLTIFFLLKRKWRLHPFTGAPLGLDACQVESTLRLRRIPPRRWPELLDWLTVCEETVLAGRG